MHREIRVALFIALSIMKLVALIYFITKSFGILHDSKTAGNRVGQIVKQLLITALLIGIFTLIEFLVAYFATPEA